MSVVAEAKVATPSNTAEASKASKPFEFTPARQEAFQKAQAARMANLEAKRKQREDMAKRIEGALTTLGSAKKEEIVIVKPDAKEAPASEEAPTPMQTEASTSDAPKHPVEETAQNAKRQKRRQAREKLLKEMFEHDEDGDEDELDPILKVLKASAYLKERARKARERIHRRRHYYDSDSDGSDDSDVSDHSSDSDSGRRKRKSKKSSKRKGKKSSKRKADEEDEDDEPVVAPARQPYRSIFDGQPSEQFIDNPAYNNPGRMAAKRAPAIRNQPVPGLGSRIDTSRLVFKR